MVSKEQLKRAQEKHNKRIALRKKRARQTPLAYGNSDKLFGKRKWSNKANKPDRV